MKTTTIIPAIIFLFIIVLSMAQLVVSNKLSTDGARLSYLEAEITSYKDKNSLLNEQILKEMSLTRISSQSAALGFVQDSNIMAISGVTRIALHQ